MIDISRRGFIVTASATAGALTLGMPLRTARAHAAIPPEVNA
ncbi:MAG: twin-arginine translocation signal domain-containing protein, partial [Beijerinckiaceae bacterium]